MPALSPGCLTLIAGVGWRLGGEGIKLVLLWFQALCLHSEVYLVTASAPPAPHPPPGLPSLLEGCWGSQAHVLAVPSLSSRSAGLGLWEKAGCALPLSSHSLGFES